MEDNKNSAIGDNSSDKELSNELEESSSTNQISNATVIEIQSTESPKQVANGQQINLQNVEAGTSDTSSQQQN